MHPISQAQAQVKEFMLKAKQDCPDRPTNIPDKIKYLRETLIKEENWEYFNAEFFEETADALCDLLYVVLGAGVAHGIDLGPCFEAVHESNMTKFIDGHMREDGKWIKGPSYTPPNLGSIIEEQLRRRL
jgi:predicted HAD superfamily Cof-like phosphohydrolase